MKQGKESWWWNKDVQESIQTRNCPRVLGMVAADGRTKANRQFKFRAIGAVTAQLH